MMVGNKKSEIFFWVCCLASLALSFSLTDAFTANQKSRLFEKTKQHSELQVISETDETNTRRDFLRVIPQSVASGVMGIHVLTTESLPALAAEEIVLPTRDTVTKCFDFIRYELNDPQGGVAYMQGRIDAEDFTGLLDFCKTYDLEFRKRRFGDAKKLLQDKEVKAQATEYANAVTFDLIGINRSCRKGQESVEFANKYLQELRDDTKKFLALEETIQVQG